MEKKEIKVMEYGEIMRKLRKISLPISFLLTPINYYEERDKFFHSNEYNPIFKYRNRDFSSVRKTIIELSEVKIIEGINPEISNLLKKIIKSKLQTAELITSIGKKDFNEKSIKKFPLPTEKYVNKSLKILRGLNRRFNTVELENRDTAIKYEYSQIVEIIYDFLDVLGVPYSRTKPEIVEKDEDYSIDDSQKNIPWRIVLTNSNSTTIKIGLKFKVIFVSRKVKFSIYRIKKILIHELASHVLRAVNGYNTGYEFLGKATVSSYLYTEEGLSSYNEMVYGLLTEKLLNVKALLTYNIYLSYKEGYSFRDLYNVNICFVPPREAFSLCSKVKRGLIDTGLPGGYTKDVVYLKGLVLTRKRVLKNPKLYNMLYAGTIPYQWVKYVKNGIIRYPEYIPNEVSINAFLATLK